MIGGIFTAAGARVVAALAGAASALALLVPASAEAVSFLAPTNFAVGAAPGSVALGNFNGDAHVDLAVTNSNSSNVSILLGDGTGGFSGPINFNAGSMPSKVAASDFNGDSDLDLAVPNAGSNNVSILLGDGTGSFSGPINFAAGTSAYSVETADFNGDSDLDLAVPNAGSNNVSILLGDGTGSFSAPTDFGVGTTPHAVAASDFNGDSDVDLAVSNAGSNNVSILLGDGTGSFSGPTNFSAGGIGPNAVAIADFNGDGKPDLAVPNSNSNNVSILLGDGTGSFSTPASFGVGGLPLSIASADFDGDDNPDLAVPNFSSGNVSILLGNGLGGFSGVFNFTTGSQPHAVAIGNFNGNPNLDLAIPRVDANSVAVLLAKATPTLSTTASANITIGAGQISDEATVSGRVNPLAGATVQFRLYGPGDTTCAGAPIFTSTVSYPVGGGSVSSSSFTPAAAGTYRWIASYSGDANNEAVAGSCNDPNESVTVAKATPTLSTSASANITIGAGALHDTATLAAGHNPTGSIEFNLYGPDDANCSAAPVFTDTVTVDSGNGNYESSTFTPTQAGTYRWIASYSGDMNNAAVAGACNDPNESVTVAKATPALSTSATSATVGNPIHDTATVSGRVDPLAGATVQFRLYGPGDTTCAGAPIFTSTVSYPVGGGSVSSSSFTPAAAGTYRWIASYSGDANNEAVAGSCNEADETSTVAQAAPTITTQASANITIGGQVHDTATLAGGHNPTGAIEFELYGPDDPTCSDSPAFTDTVSVSGNDDYESSTFTPTQAGTYRWVASYSGDMNNAAVAGACNDPNESVTVAKATPTLSTSASAGITLGAGQLTDSATVSGRVNPDDTGTVTFDLYGPDNPTCTGTPVFTSTAPYPAGGGPVSSTAFTPTQAGTYRWVASYSGDANNDQVRGACNDPDESVSVEPAPTPAIPTCLQVTASAGNYTPESKVEGRTVPGVRARITFNTPSRLQIKPTLSVWRKGRRYSSELPERSLAGAGSRNLRLALPVSLRPLLPLGAKVRLSLQITATPRSAPGCASPRVSHRSHWTRVVRVLLSQ